MRPSDLEESRTGSWDVARSPAAQRTARARQNRWSWSRRRPSSAGTGRADTQSTRRPPQTASSPHPRWSRWCWWAEEKAPLWGLFINTNALNTVAKQFKKKQKKKNGTHLKWAYSSRFHPSCQCSPCCGRTSCVCRCIGRCYRWTDPEGSELQESGNTWLLVNEATMRSHAISIQTRTRARFLQVWTCWLTEIAFGVKSKATNGGPLKYAPLQLYGLKM